MKNWIFSLVVIIANFLGAQSVSPITGIPQFMGIPVEGDAVLFINKLMKEINMIGLNPTASPLTLF